MMVKLDIWRGSRYGAWVFAITHDGGCIQGSAWKSEEQAYERAMAIIEERGWTLAQCADTQR